MKQLVKFVSYAMVLVLLLIPLAPSVMAASNEECTHGTEEPHEHYVTEVLEEGKDDGQTRNILCSLFGHKLTVYSQTIVSATKIDSTQCQVSYVESGYCDRCSELVDYLRTEVLNHNIKVSGNRYYCTYGCGYEVWNLK